MADLNKMTFEELVDYFALRVHSGLLERGGKGMKEELFMAMDNAIRWGVQKAKSNYNLKTSPANPFNVTFVAGKKGDACRMIPKRPSAKKG